MSACDAHDLSVAQHDLLHHPATMQPGGVHPLHAGAKWRVVHENQGRRIRTRGERVVEPAQPLFAHHSVIMFRHSGIEANEA